MSALDRHRCIHIIVFNKSDLVPRSLFPKLSAIAASENANSHLFLDSLRASSSRQVACTPPPHLPASHAPELQAHPVAADIARAVLQRGRDPKKSLLCMYAHPRPISISLHPDFASCRVCGVPNTGKSSLINSLRVSCGLSRVAAVGAVPGITRAISMFPISKVIEVIPALLLFHSLHLQAPPTYIIDTPGIMMPSVTNWPTAAALAAVGCISVARVDPVSVLAFCLRRIGANFSSGRGVAPSASCPCSFIVQKTRGADAAAGLQASVTVVALWCHAGGSLACSGLPMCCAWQ